MTSKLMIARRDGTVRNTETGERYRLLKGRTVADAEHPAVKLYPEAFMPLTVELRVEDEQRAVSDPESDGDLAEELAEVESERDYAQGVLRGLAEALAERGLVDRDNPPNHEGWLAETLLAAIDRAAAPTVSEVPAGTAAPKPRRPRPRAASDAD